MKKIYLIGSVLAALSCMSTASAQNIDSAFAYGYCTDHIDGVGSSAGVSNYWMAGAFQMTESDVERFDGCEIAGVSIGFGSGRNKEVTVFFTNDLAGEPFATQKGRTRASQWNDIELTTPVKIEKGKPFYVGYRHNVQNSTAKPVGCDGNKATYTPTADWLSLADNEAGLASEWKHYGESFGNVCLRVYIKGNSLPTSNCVPTSLTMPDHAVPGTPFEFTLSFSNASTAEVKDLEVEYTLGTDPAQTATVTLAAPVAANGKGEVRITASTMQDSFELPVSARITKVNGNPNDMADRSVSMLFVCTDGLFERKVVAEKYTGTDCGYCPRGIVGFEYMNLYYPEKFIGISIQNYKTSDPMYCAYYGKALSTFGITGAPDVLIDRNKTISREPNKSALENSFKLEYTDACEIGVFAGFEKSDVAGCVTVSGTVRVSRDVENADYSLTFVITEDSVGPYTQYSNYNTGTGCPEWVGKGLFVNMLYEDVARYIHPDWNGIPGSVPASMQAGKEYTWTVKDMSLGRTAKFENASVIALLIDNATGLIVNADRKRFDPTRVPPVPPVPPVSGVENVEYASAPLCGNVTVENGCIYYKGEGSASVYAVSGTAAGTLSEGRPLTVAPGMYIVKTAAESVKVIVK